MFKPTLFLLIFILSLSSAQAKETDFSYTKDAPLFFSEEILSSYFKNSPNVHPETPPLTANSDFHHISKIDAACILLAADTYSVPPSVLLGIYFVKNGEAEKSYGPLPDGSYDLGIMGINTAEIPALAKLWEASEQQVKTWIQNDPCISAGVAAHRLSEAIKQGRSLPESIASYNQGTDEENKRFKDQVISAMLKNGLVRSK